MHRHTPLTQGYVGYTGSGARALVDKIDDAKEMQEMGGSMMFGESRDKIESPQNYGFTSVVKEATKGKDGQIEECAEAYMSFLGGDRSFPVATVMDDRRYRLKELKPGDVAFYDHQQHQFHFNEDGAFLTGLTKKKVRFQLADPDEQQQGSGGATPTQRADAVSGASSDSSSGQQKKRGQKARYKKESKKFVDINTDTIDVAHDKTINIKADQAINFKTPTHTFDGDVLIKGELKVVKNLRVGMEGYKPSNGEWLAGGVDGMGNVAMTAEQRAYQERKKAIASKIRIDDSGNVFIDGDFTVTGDLTVNGVVRAKDFVKI